MYEHSRIDYYPDGQYRGLIGLSRDEITHINVYSLVVDFGWRKDFLHLKASRINEALAEAEQYLQHSWDLRYYPNPEKYLDEEEEWIAERVLVALCVINEGNVDFLNWNHILREIPRELPDQSGEDDLLAISPSSRTDEKQFEEALKNRVTIDLDIWKSGQEITKNRN